MLNKDYQKTKVHCLIVFFYLKTVIVLLWLFPSRQQLGMLLIIGIFSLVECPLWMFVRVNYFELK